jgi:thiamine-monophosphate kinase
MRRPTLGPGAEFELLRRVISRQPDAAGQLGGRVVVGPGDDCVVLHGNALAISTDMSVEGIHFRRDWLSPREIGYRSAVTALSDLAAMAASPVGVLASIGVPAEEASTLVEEIAAGIGEAATAAGGLVLGGDLSRTPGPVVIDVVAIGDAPAPVLRDGAKPGDELWVTGMLGGAAAAVAAWLGGNEPGVEAARAFRRPVARTAEARWLAERVALHALIDLSDGLAGDAGHLAAASNVGIVLEPERVPIHPGLRGYAEEETIAIALGGGDDYELCFATPARAVDAIADEFQQAFGVRMTRVGTVVEGSGVLVRGPDGELRPPSVRGFTHFTRSDP